MDVRYEIDRELGANAYRIHAKVGGRICAILTGYINHRAHTVKCYPVAIKSYEAYSIAFPVIMRQEELFWTKK